MTRCRLAAEPRARLMGPALLLFVSGCAQPRAANDAASASAAEEVWLHVAAPAAVTVYEQREEGGQLVPLELCDAPCDRKVSRAQALVVAGPGVAPSAPVVLPPAERVVLTVTPGDAAARRAGNVTATVALVTGVAAALTLIVSGVAYGGAGDGDRDTILPVVVGSGITTGVAGGVLGIGLGVAGANRTEVEVSAAR